MFEQEFVKQLRVIDALREIYPKMSLEMAGVLLCVCYHERIPLTQIGERLNLPQVTVHRHVSALSRSFYKRDRYEEGFGLLSTEEDPENRVRKIAFLSKKGEEVRDQLLGLLQDRELVEAKNRRKK